MAGHPDQHFVDMVEARKEKLFTASGTIAAFLDKSFQVALHGHSCLATVRMSGCQILCSTVKCTHCVGYRDVLRAMYHRWRKWEISPSRPSTSSHINDRWLTTPEKKMKTNQMRIRIRSAESAVKYLKEKIAASTEKRGVYVDDSLHTGLEAIMLEENEAVQKKYDRGLVSKWS